MLTHDELSAEIKDVLTLSPTAIIDQEKLRERLIDVLIYQAHLAEKSVADLATSLIFDLAPLSGVKSSSIRPLYQAIAKDEIEGLCVPAFNIRTLTYETAQTIFRIMKEKKILPVVFELARSEMEYTDQSPSLYAATILAAGIKTGYQGPVFIQGDHFQVNASSYKENAEKEITAIKELISSSLDGQIYNIDIDASTLVDLSQSSLSEQQRQNADVTDTLIQFIRSHQPIKANVSIGAEIGHIGDRNSTTDDLRAFVTQLTDVTELSKISVQTGTSHGGIVLPDGSIKEASVDFNVLKEVGNLARSTYHLGGVVQHGASTLPTDLLNKFLEVNTLEIHLATHTQTVIFDNIPSELLKEIEAWISDNLSEKRLSDETDQQFFYKNRKYALSQFKKRLWDLHGEEKVRITKALESYFSEIFRGLSLENTREKTLSYFS